MVRVWRSAGAMFFFFKSGRICSPTETIPGSHLAVKEANLESACLGVQPVCVCVRAAAVSRQLTPRLSRRNVLMDRL